MKETSEYLNNIMDIVLACRQINGKIRARLKDHYADNKTIIVKLSENAQSLACIV